MVIQDTSHRFAAYTRGDNVLNLHDLRNINTHDVLRRNSIDLRCSILSYNTLASRATQVLRFSINRTR